MLQKYYSNQEESKTQTTKFSHDFVRHSFIDTHYKGNDKITTYRTLKLKLFKTMAAAMKCLKEFMTAKMQCAGRILTIIVSRGLVFELPS
mgnify:FL=1